MVKPGFVLTSMVKRVDNAVYNIVQEVVEGKFFTWFACVWFGQRRC